MTEIGHAQADRIVEMSKELLMMQFPSFRIVPSSDRHADECIIHDSNAGGDPYVGAYSSNGYFVVIVTRLSQSLMEKGDKWHANVLVSSKSASGDDHLDEQHFIGETPADLMSKIASKLNDFRPYDTPYIVYMSNDCRSVLTMPESDWNADCENGQCPGNFLAKVTGDSREYAILEFIALHPRSDEFLDLCGISPAPERSSPSL
jgi:hypothetical protein